MKSLAAGVLLLFSIVVSSPAYAVPVYDATSASVNFINSYLGSGLETLFLFRVR